ARQGDVATLAPSTKSAGCATTAASCSRSGSDDASRAHEREVGIGVEVLGGEDELARDVFAAARSQPDLDDLLEQQAPEDVARDARPFGAQRRDVTRNDLAIHTHAFPPGVSSMRPAAQAGDSGRPMTLWPVLACAIAVALLLVADRRGSQRGVWIWKPLA